MKPVGSYSPERRRDLTWKLELDSFRRATVSVLVDGSLELVMVTSRATPRYEGD
jgi:hypothetical protein